MHAQLLEMANTTYQSDYIQPGIACLEPEQAKMYYKGFRGPPCFNESNVPIVPTPAPTPADTFQLESSSPQGAMCLTRGARGLGMAACGGAGPAALAPRWQVGDTHTGELEYAAGGGGHCIKLHEETGW